MKRRQTPRPGPLLTPGALPVLVLDACVLSRMIDTDTLPSLGQAGLVLPVWSPTIESEWRRNLLMSRPELQEAIAKRAHTMNEFFPDACVLTPPPTAAHGGAPARALADAVDSKAGARGRPVEPSNPRALPAGAPIRGFPRAAAP